MPAGKPMRHLMLLVLLGITACGNGDDGPVGPPRPTPTAAPTPDPRTIAIPGASTGPTTITFLEAEPALGSTIGGCGPSLDGCPQSVRMRFRLLSPSAGPVLWVVGFLHGTNIAACFRGRAEGFTLEASQPQEVELLFDTPDLDACAPPATIAHLAVVVEGTVEVASRQEWAVWYQLEP
jgi:hypothetical protein